MKSDMTPAQKRLALEELTTSAFASGLLSLVPVYTGAKGLKRNGSMKLDVDPANPKRLVANFETGAELAGQTAPAAAKKKGPLAVLKQEEVQLPGGEIHTYAVLSDGRVIRCSDGCGHIAESVSDRLDDLGLLEQPVLLARQQGRRVGRRGFEAEYHTELKTVKGESNEGVPLKSITGVEHQRAHVRGQITGFEFSEIPYAPTYVNQQLQAQGIELFTSSLRKTHPDKEFMLRTEHALIPDTRRQAWIDYHVAVVEKGKQRDLVTVRIGTDYENAARPANYEIRAISNREADQALLLTVDMPAARKELEDIIKKARERRRSGR
jgi:hypothetical protein